MKKLGKLIDGTEHTLLSFEFRISSTKNDNRIDIFGESSLFILWFSNKFMIFLNECIHSVSRKLVPGDLSERIKNSDLYLRFICVIRSLMASQKIDTHADKLKACILCILCILSVSIVPDFTIPFF